MPSNGQHDDNAFSSARTLTIPDARVVAIEHPCIVRDADKVINTLGPSSVLEKVISL